MNTTKEMFAYHNRCNCCGELFWTSVMNADLCYECIEKENTPKRKHISDAMSVTKRDVIKELKKDLLQKADYITFKYEVVEKIYKLLMK